MQIKMNQDTGDPATLALLRREARRIGLTQVKIDLNDLASRIQDLVNRGPDSRDDANLLIQQAAALLEIVRPFSPILDQRTVQRYADISETIAAYMREPDNEAHLIRVSVSLSEMPEVQDQLDDGHVRTEKPAYSTPMDRGDPPPGCQETPIVQRPPTPRPPGTLPDRDHLRPFREPHPEGGWGCPGPETGAVS